MRPPHSPAHARHQTARVRPRGVVVAIHRSPTAARATLVVIAGLLALAAPGRVARAQSAAADTSTGLLRATRAFDPAVTLWVGATNFGNRSYTTQATFGYSSAITLGLTGEYPVTRRTAVMGDVSIVPGAKQEVSGAGNAGSFNANSALVAAADVGLAGRLKANVPVFLFAGVGVMHASRYAYPTADGGSATEPRGTLAVGFDGGRASGDRVGIRAVVAAHFSKPADASVADLTTKSLTTDYSFQLGMRLRVGERGMR